MGCVTSGCPGKGLKKNSGWCDACYHDHTNSFDRNRRDAENLVLHTGRSFLVAELPSDTPASRRAAKIGKRAYGAYRASDRSALESSGYRVCEVYDTTGRIEQTEYAP